MKRSNSPRRIENAFAFVTSGAYLIVGLVLMAIAFALIGYSLWETWGTLTTGTHAVTGLLDAIGLIVIAMAVLDVGKYLIEEEVIRDRELRSAVEARQTMTKFMVIIIIVVSLEGVVYIIKAGRSALSDLVYPTMLLLSAVAIMVGLGVYQKLSGPAEIKDKEHPAD